MGITNEQIWRRIERIELILEILLLMEGNLELYPDTKHGKKDFLSDWGEVLDTIIKYDTWVEEGS